MPTDWGIHRDLQKIGDVSALGKDWLLPSRHPYLVTRRPAFPAGSGEIRVFDAFVDRQVQSLACSWLPLANVGSRNAEGHSMARAMGLDGRPESLKMAETK
jgi:hypothetical protein